MITVLPIIKGVAGIATSLGAGAVVGNAIKATTPDNLTTVSKVLIGIGGITLSSIAGDLASTYIEAQIQGVVDGVRNAKATAEAVKEAAHDIKEAVAEDIQKESKEGDKPAE